MGGYRSTTSSWSLAARSGSSGSTNVGERVVFGEITNYAEGGWASFDPPEFDQELGAFWDASGHRRLPWLNLPRRKSHKSAR